MRHLLFGASILAAVALISCGKSDSNAGSAVTDTTASLPTTVTAPTVPASTAGDTGTSATVSTPDLKATVAAPASGPNPPHGQPGHRCDIAVGAPLTSAPASAPTAATPPVSTGQMQPQTQQMPVQVKPGSGGDNGFTSRSATVEVKPVPAGSGAATPAAPNGNMSGKINPPHGQPGHDCKVPVGQPLP